MLTPLSGSVQNNYCLYIYSLHSPPPVNHTKKASPAYALTHNQELEFICEFSKTGVRLSFRKFPGGHMLGIRLKGREM
jgi:hypothetical protein